MKAILITKDDTYKTELTEIEESQLPEGDVTVKVDYSTLNYKDSLAITGSSPVVRNFPMVPGVDLVGTVEESSNPNFKVGDKIIAGAQGIGELHWGGLAEKAHLKSEWLIPLPSAFTPRQAIGIGTAGFTAMRCVMALEDHDVTPDKGEIIVTGAAGGVGSVAVSILAKLGYTVVASSGRVSEETDYLKQLGVAEIMDRAELSEPGKPLGKERWAGAVDVVGSHTLANICATTKYGGTVTACGLAQGLDFPSTVMPFILRNVTLAGIDSVYTPKPERLKTWERLSQDLNTDHIETMINEINLDQAIATAPNQLAGKTRGRVIVNINA